MFQSIILNGVFMIFGAAAIPTVNLANQGNHWVPDCATVSEGSFLPDPFDCNKFWICTNDGPKQGTCPPGLEFNPTIAGCDFPHNFVCTPEATSTPIVTVTITPTTVTTRPTTTPTPTTTMTPTTTVTTTTTPTTRPTTRPTTTPTPTITMTPTTTVTSTTTPTTTPTTRPTTTPTPTTTMTQTTTVSTSTTPTTTSMPTTTGTSTTPSGCPESFPLVLGPSCYFFSPPEQFLSWGTAKSICLQRGGQLAEIVDQTDENAIDSYIRANFDVLNTDYRWWLGGNDIDNEGSWIWETTRVPISYSAWFSDQPDDDKGREDCLIIRKEGRNEDLIFGWDDRDCSDNHSYICQFRL
ncbi:mucin-2-like isoform X2 [Tigriopus californicus]|uniref:mucin-2-like isoform X2 n=1 Tax=Tigriopus californicus TaxID=6832 RepID=UPI0027DA7F6D|nr:mucin-2-like isoform X2 [Tigriopus californicus]